MSSAEPPQQHLPEKDFDPSQLNLILRVTLAADRNAVDPVVQEVMAVVRQMKDVDGKEDAIELALQEALANAVIHGAKEDPRKTVECLVSSDQERGILIVVRDPGKVARIASRSSSSRSIRPLPTTSTCAITNGVPLPEW